jgi:hypothetical protein
MGASFAARCHLDGEPPGSHNGATAPGEKRRKKELKSV